MRSVLDKDEIASSYAKLPLRFEANYGQSDPAVKFMARSGGATVFLTDTEAVLSLSPKATSEGGRRHDVIRMSPAGMNASAKAEGVDRLLGVSNYLLGNDPSRWRTGVPGYAGVRYRAVYPNIDLVFHGKQDVLEYDFVVAPGGDPNEIDITVSGARKVELDASGDLVLDTPSGQLRQQRPQLYQDIGGTRRPVAGSFVITESNHVGFSVGTYDRSLPLVIDPVISYATLLGGTSDESGMGIDIDASGSAYVAGTTRSLDFPTTTDAVDTTCGAGTAETCNANAYVTKLTPDGAGVVYSTYVGGSVVDRGKGVSVNAAGRAALYGDTRSVDFPTTEGGFDRTCGNPGDPAERCMDVFVAQLQADGAGLTFSTFVGGGDDDWAGQRGDAFNTYASQGVGTLSTSRPSESIWITGSTLSSDFPATLGSVTPFDSACGTGVEPLTGLPDGSCNSDAHFTDGVATSGSTTLTSASARFTNADVGKPIRGQNIPDDTVVAALTDATSLVLSAAATATANDIRFTIVARNERRPDAFVAKILPSAQEGLGSLYLASYLGGGGADSGNGIAVRLEGNGDDFATVTGSTQGRDFPTTPEAFDKTCGNQSDPTAACNDGSSDAFVTRMSSSRFLVFSTYLGGSQGDVGTAVTDDSAGNVYVTGQASSRGFPTKNAFQSETEFGSGFVTKLVPDGSAILFSTFLDVDANGIAVDSNRNVYVSGTASRNDFPTKDPVQAFAGAATDAVVTKLAPSGSSLVYSTFLGGAGDEFAGGIALDAAANAYVTGMSTDQSGFPRPAGSVRYGPGGANEAYVVKLGKGVTPVVASIAPRGGSTLGGTPVSIRGSGLTGVIGVTFGDAPAASFTVISDSEIVATSPPHSGATFEELTVPVRVTTAVAFSFNVVRYVYGEGAFHATQPCLGACPRDAEMLTLPSGKILYASRANSQLFDPATAAWSVTESPPAFDRRSLTLLPSGPPALCGANCGKVLATGGDESAALYDPAAGSWAATGSMSVPRTGHSMTLLPSGKVLAAGGCFGNPCESAELYDPLTGDWSPTGSMVGPRLVHSATLIDPAKGPCGMTCGKVLVAFGAGNDIFGPGVETAELYDPTTGTWQATGSSLGTGRLNHAALQLRDGRVMTIAGEGALYFGQPLDSVDVFDPLTESWTLNSILNFPRSFPKALELPSGKVLVVGPALNFEGPQVDQAEIWSPADNRWRSATTTAVAPRNSHAGVAQIPSGPVSACGLNCGKVLVAGGRVDVETSLGDAELYTPASLVTGIAPASGSSTGGTAVTITGTGLASATARLPYTGVTFGGAPATSITPDPLTPDTKLVATSPPNAAGTADVRVTNLAGHSPTSSSAKFTFQAPAVTTTPTTGSGGTGTATTAPTGAGTGGTATTDVAQLLSGYRLVASDGGVFAFGLPFLGSTGAIKLAQPMVGTASTPSGKGYWMVAADGGVFAFGDAKFFGSTGGIRLAKPIVGMAVTPTGNGYWLVASDGGIFAFGDARFFGSTGAIKLAQDVVGMAPTPAGNGYWLVAKDGGIFAFGDAKFFGSTGAIRLAQQVVGMAASPSGNGYRLVAADGGIFAFGDAGFFGSTGAIALAQPMVGMASTPSGKGYILVAKDGGTFVLW